jgi:hypothetical protein
VNRIVRVHHIDSLTLDREFYVNGTTAIISWKRWTTGLLRLVFNVWFLLFLQLASPVPILPAVSAYIFEPGTVTTFFVFC